MLPNLKLYIIAAGIIALCALLAYGAHIKHKADRTDAAERALADYQGAVAAREQQEAADREKAAKRSAVLAATLDSVTAHLDQLRANPPKQSVKYVQTPGESCPQLRLDPEWVQQYQTASQASAVSSP